VWGYKVNVMDSQNNTAVVKSTSRTDPASYRSTERKIQFGFALALACLALIGAVSYLSLGRLTDNASLVTYTHEVSNGFDRLLLATTEAESAQRGYIISGETSYLEAYDSAIGVVDSTFAELQRLVADNGAQQQRLTQLRMLLNERLALSDNRIELRRTQGLAVVALAPRGEGRRLQQRLRDAIAQAKDAELLLLREREARARRSTTVTRIVIIGGGLLAVTLVGLSMLLIRRDLAARRLAEKQLDRFFAVSLDFLCISSTDGYFKRVSPAVTDILGWSVTEFLSTPYMDLVHPDDHAATVREVEKQIVDGEKVMRFENRYRHKDGSWRTLSWRSAPQPDGLMYGTARDVTEIRAGEAELRQAKDELETRVQKRTAELAAANESLRRSERRFRALIEHGGDAMTLIDKDNKILYVSPAVTAIEGYTVDELLGRSGSRDAHPDDVESMQQSREKLASSPGMPVPITWRRRHKHGHWIWLEGVATNLLHDPDVGAIVSNYRNVSAHKQAESRLQAQVARLALLSQITRAIGEHQDPLSIFRIVVGCVQQQLPVDVACLALHQPDGNAPTITIAAVAANSELAGHHAFVEQSVIEVDPDGLSRCMGGTLVHEPRLGTASTPFAQRLHRDGLHALVAAPLLTENKVFGILIAARTQPDSFSSGECEFLRQLSEHVALALHQSELHASLQQAYEELRQTQQSVMDQERLRVLGQMASGIAHDINNAISPVSLYTETLLESERNISEKGRGQLQTIRRAIDDVAETVGRMREFYRQRDAEVTLTSLQLNTLIPQVTELTRARWSDMPQSRGTVIDLRTEISPQLPPILGVESELREALTNLIFNAVDAMPDGGVLTIRTGVLNTGEHEQQRVILEVIDSGVGMTADTRRRCLELFFTTKGERGTGLGLAMVYGIVQRHHGDIEIDSSPGKGTRVQLVFKASDPEQPKASIAAPTLPEGLRMLVIDDDTIILESMEVVLKNSGFEVVTASGGQQGIDAFAAALQQKAPFDMVITDLGMPCVDGRRVASAIKGLSPMTPIIMLTGWGQRMASDGETPAHVDRVLGKPPKPLELRNTIAELASRTADAG
jgi:PAS domain S-box-containing protein